jgi:hypothetical protein
MRSLARASALLAGMFARLATLALLLAAGFTVALLVDHALRVNSYTVSTTVFGTTTVEKVKLKVRTTSIMVTTVPVAQATDDRKLIVVAPSRSQLLQSGFTVAGSADVFNGVVAIHLIDNSGHWFASQSTFASCGTGCRGSFAVNVDYYLDSDQPGILLVEDTNARGKKKVLHVLKIPVLLLANPAPAVVTVPTLTPNGLTNRTQTITQTTTSTSTASSESQPTTKP